MMSMQLLVSLLVVASVLQGEPLPVCPVESPCQCLWDNPQNDSPSHVNVISCSAQRLTEETLPPIARSNVSFYKLDFSKNSLDGVPAGYLDLFRNDVLTIDLSHNKLRTVPDAVRTLQNLNQLWLKDNTIDISSGQPFLELGNLNYLALSKNDIQTVRRTTFHGLTSLQFLLLDENRLSDIEDNSFTELKLLRQIDLSKNSLSTLRAPIFAGLEGLQKLVLNYNKLDTIPSSTFQQLGNLQTLEIKGNGLHNIDVRSFNGLVKVVSLDMSNNDLISFPSRVFQPLSQLRSLNLGMNRLGEVQTLAFRGISSRLNVFRVSFNPIHEFPLGFFDLFPQLQILLLSGLPLEHLPNVTTLTQLTGMSVAGTSISRIYPCEWEGLDKLKTFSMANCPLLCNCHAQWLWRWYDEHLDADVKHFTETRAPWICASPPEMNGREFHDVTLSQMTCADGELSTWCENILTDPTSLEIFLNILQGTERSLEVWWNSTASPDILQTGHGRLLYYAVGYSNEVYLMNVSLQSQQSSLRDLKGGHDYMICLEVYGVTGQLLGEKCSSASAPPSNPSMSMAPRLRLAIALPLTLILLAICGLLLIYWRTRASGENGNGSGNAFENVGYGVQGSERISQTGGGQPILDLFPNNSVRLSHLQDNAADNDKCASDV